MSRDDEQVGLGLPVELGEPSVVVVHPLPIERDSLGVRDYVTMQLETLGYKVIVAANAEIRHLIRP